MEYLTLSQQWLTGKVARGNLTAATANGQLANLKAFGSHIGEGRTVDSITIADFENWMASLHTCYQPGSVRTKASPIRQFMAWAHREGHIARNPCLDVGNPPLPDNPPRSLTRASFDRLIHTSSDRSTVFRDRTMIIVAFGLGLRISEMARMRVEHYDPDQQTMFLYRKGRKERYQPCEGAVVPAVEDWIHYGLWGAASGPMWPSPRRRGENLDRGYIGVVLKRSGAEVGVRMTAHELRHTRATFMAQDGVPQSIIQEFLDHSDPAMTARYTRATKSDVRRWMLDTPDYIDLGRVRRATGLDQFRIPEPEQLELEVGPGPDRRSAPPPPSFAGR